MLWVLIRSTSVKIYLSNQDLFAQKMTFFLSVKEIYVVDTHLKCLSEALLISTQNQFSSRNKKKYSSRNLDGLLSYCYKVLVPGQVK